MRGPIVLPAALAIMLAACGAEGIDGAASHSAAPAGDDSEAVQEDTTATHAEAASTFSWESCAGRRTILQRVGQVLQGDSAAAADLRETPAPPGLQDEWQVLLRVAATGEVDTGPDSAVTHALDGLEGAALRDPCDMTEDANEDLIVCSLFDDCAAEAVESGSTGLAVTDQQAALSDAWDLVECGGASESEPRCRYEDADAGLYIEFLGVPTTDGRYVLIGAESS